MKIIYYPLIILILSFEQIAISQRIDNSAQQRAQQQKINEMNEYINTFQAKANNLLTALTVANDPKFDEIQNNLVDLFISGLRYSRSVDYGSPIRPKKLYQVLVNIYDHLTEKFKSIISANGIYEIRIRAQ